MAKRPRPKPTLPPPQEALDKISKAIADFTGNAGELESAIGFYFVGHAFGWRVMHMVHSVATVRKYEKILGIVAKDEFPENTSHSDRSLAFEVLDKVSNFWKAVKGERRPDGFTNPEITRGI